MANWSLVPKRVEVALRGTASLLANADPYSTIYETGVGVPHANTYADETYARRYFVGRRLHSSAWTTATTDTQKIALKQASALLDVEFYWVGSGPLRDTQGLAWPRADALDKNGLPLSGVPKAIRDATCELAFYLLQEERLTAREGVGIHSLKVDVISITFDQSLTPETFPPHVARMVSLYGVPVRGNGQVRTVRLARV